jgi:multisubunit Na+/H+ antiporter MnhC subunit
MIRSALPLTKMVIGVCVSPLVLSSSYRGLSLVSFGRAINAFC